MLSSKILRYVSNCLFLFFTATLPLAGCKTINNDLHPLTREVLVSGIRLNNTLNGLTGFSAYAISPDAKAFAVSASKSGHLYAWGKA